jgi:S-formylglutathione hydrolase FrmB
VGAGVFEKLVSHFSFLKLISFYVLLAMGFIVSGEVFGGEDLITEGRVGADQVIVHRVRSGYQSGETLIRVLLPDRVEEGRRYAVLYVLPVEAGDGERWGDPVSVVKRDEVASRHGLVCVFPTFSELPWYADHATDLGIRQESYFLKVVIPYVEKTYPVLAEVEGRLLIGFSKSGWGAWSLLLRHPEVFGKAAAFDAPLMMEELGRFGTAGIFGTEANFEEYRVTTLLAKRAGRFQGGRRLVLVGTGNFQADHDGVLRVMEGLLISYAYRSGRKREHHWNSGWVPEAVDLLLGNADGDEAK